MRWRWQMRQQRRSPSRASTAVPRRGWRMRSAAWREGTVGWAKRSVPTGFTAVQTRGHASLCPPYQPITVKETYVDPVGWGRRGREAFFDGVICDRMDPRRVGKAERAHGFYGRPNPWARFALPTLPADHLE